MRVGLFGGSFDPIHKGHLKLAAAALKQLRLDRVYFIVSPLSPFKTDKKLAPPSLRFQMVQAAIEGRKNFVAADWELRRRGPSYTITTVRSYRRRRPDDELFLIFGTDALEGFPRWRNHLYIARHATLVAGLRPGAEWPSLPASVEKSVVRLKGRFPDVSSTEVRQRIASGKRIPLLPPVVVRFIRREGLYK